MRFSFQAGLLEYWDRREQFIKSLAQRVGEFDSDLADILQKALPAKEPELKWKFLRDLQEQTKEAYQQQIKKMLVEVGKILDQSAPKGLRKAFEHIEPGEQEPKEYQTEEEKQLEAEYDPVTGEPRPEPEEPPEEEEPEEYEEPELAASIRARNELNKALYIGPRGGKWADPAHTISWSPEMEQVHARRGEAKDGSLAHVVAQHGGKITAHKSDPNLAMIKIPHEHEAALHEIKKQLNISATPIKGEKYIMLPVAKDLVSESIQKPKAPITNIPDSMPSEKLTAITKLMQQIPLQSAAHKTDPNKLMIKTPQKHAAGLQQLASILGVDPKSVQTGAKNAMLAIDKTQANIIVAAMKTMPEIKKEKPAPKIMETAPPVAASKPKGNIPEIPKYAKFQNWKNADTMEQAQEFFKQVGVDATFPDLSTANAVGDALRRSHPAVIEHCQFIGTGEQLKTWAQNHPEVAEAAKAGKHALDITKHSPLGGGAIAIAHPIGEKPYTQSAIVVLDSWWNAHKAEKASQLQHGGFSLSENLCDVVIHELGHVEGFALRHLKVGDSTAWEIWKKHVVPRLKDKTKKKQLMHEVSEYAATTPHEAWAEIAVMRRKGMQVPDWVQTAIDEMGIDKQDWATMSTGWKWGGK